MQTTVFLFRRGASIPMVVLLFVFTSLSCNICMNCGFHTFGFSVLSSCNNLDAEVKCICYKRISPQVCFLLANSG